MSQPIKGSLKSKDSHEFKKISEIRDGEERLKNIQAFVQRAFEGDLFQWNHDRQGASLTIRVDKGVGMDGEYKDLVRLIVSGDA
jgi:hypothetical protein